MKFIWEEKDIKGGLRVTKEGIKETWIIGWFPVYKADPRFVLVSLSYGMVDHNYKSNETVTGYTRAEMAEMLTKDDYISEDALIALFKKT